MLTGVNTKIHPMKLCECGCGEPAPIAKQSITARGWIKGEPLKYIRGHSTKGRNLGPYDEGRRANIAAGLRRAHAENPELAKRMSEARKGKPRPPEVLAKFSAALRGRKLSAEHRAKLSQVRKGRPTTPAMQAAYERLTGDGHPSWKGDEASYHWKHQWLEKHHPKAGACAFCALAGEKTEWAFLYHPEPHTRNPEDYIELCIKCHRRMDAEERIERLAWQRLEELLAEGN